MVLEQIVIAANKVAEQIKAGTWAPLDKVGLIEQGFTPEQCESIEQMAKVLAKEKDRNDS